MEEKNLFAAINDLKKNYPNSWGDKEQFNVFTALRPISDEVYLHSRFIATMLDPKGLHNLGTKPLDIFLEEIGSNFSCGKNPTVRPNPRVENWKEEEEIDILIEGVVKDNKDKEDANINGAIIIENKIYAKDSNHPEKGKGQLQGYYHYIQSKHKYSDKQIETYYLTPNRHEPSDYSLHGDKKTVPQLDVEPIGNKGKHPCNKKVRCIDYGKEICQWINKVQGSTTEHNLQEALMQYEQVVKKLVGDIELNEKLSDLVSALLDKNKEMKCEMLKELLGDRFIDVQWHAIASFMDNLGNELQQLKIEVEGRSSHLAITDLLYHPNKHTPIYFRIKQNGIVWTLQADDRCRERGFFLGIDNTTMPNIEKCSEIEELNLKENEYTNIEGWHAIKYLNGQEAKIESEEGEQTKVLPLLNLWDFTQGNTFDLLNEKERKIIAQQYALFVKDELAKLN